MVTWEEVRRQVVIAGKVSEKVNEAQTGWSIGVARVRIIGAPEEFVAAVVNRASLVELRDVVTDALRAVLSDSATSSAEKLQTAQVILDYGWLVSSARVLQSKAIDLLGQVLEDPGQTLSEKLKKMRVVFDSLENTVQGPDMPARIDRTYTAADGYFHFTEAQQRLYADGSYTLTASLPAFGSRYGTGQVETTVAHDADEDIAIVDILLPATTLRGDITGQGTERVVMAEVQVEGSGERGFSDSLGQYRMTGVEVGERTVWVSAKGYERAAKTVQLKEAGAVETLDFALTPVAL